MKVTVLFVLCALSTYVWAQDCNNPLLKLFNFAALPNPVSGVGSPYCGNLQSGLTCCANSTVGSFQNSLNSLRDSLQNQIAAKDQYLASLNQGFLQQFRNLLNQLNTLDTTALGGITNVAPSVGADIQTDVNYFNQISQDLADVTNSFNADLLTYQAARAQCLTTVLKVQASLWCLACDANYAQDGVYANGAIAFSQGLCQQISGVCVPFLDDRVVFNPLYRAQQSLARITNLIQYIQSFANTGNIPTNTITGDTTPANTTAQTVTIPEGCTATSCVWQCQNLFTGVQLNQDLLASGAGIIGGNDIQLAPISNPPAANGAPGRLLQGSPSVWSPNIDSTGLLFTVNPDPAGLTQTPNSAGNAPPAIVPKQAQGGSKLYLSIVVATLSVLGVFLV